MIKFNDVSTLQLFSSQIDDINNFVYVIQEDIKKQGYLLVCTSTAVISMPLIGNDAEIEVIIGQSNTSGRQRQIEQFANVRIALYFTDGKVEIYQLPLFISICLPL